MSDVYRSNPGIRVFAKNFTIDEPGHYWFQVQGVTKFVNKLLEAGVQKNDIKIFQANFVHYDAGKQFSKIMFTILYYAYQEISS